jgi:hypothetical protein
MQKIKITAGIIGLKRERRRMSTGALDTIMNINVTEMKKDIKH